MKIFLLNKTVSFFLIFTLLETIILPTKTVTLALPRTHEVTPERYKVLRQTIFDQNGITLPNLEVHNFVTEKFGFIFKPLTFSANKYFNCYNQLSFEAGRYFRGIVDKIFSRKCIAADYNILLPVSVYLFGIPNNKRKMRLKNYEGEEHEYTENFSFYGRFNNLDEKTKRDFLFFLDVCDEIYEKEKNDLFNKYSIIKNSYDYKKKMQKFEKSEYDLLYEIATDLKLEKSFFEIMKHTKNIVFSFENLSDDPSNLYIGERHTNCQARLKMVFDKTLPIVNEAIRDLYGITRVNTVNNRLNMLEAIYAQLIEEANEYVCETYPMRNLVLSPEIMNEVKYFLSIFGANRFSLPAPSEMCFLNTSDEMEKVIKMYASSIFSLERIHDISKSFYESDGVTDFDSFGMNGATAKISEISFAELCQVLGIDSENIKKDLLNEIKNNKLAFTFNGFYGVKIGESDIINFIDGKKNMNYRDIVLSTDNIGNVILFLLSKSKLHYYKNPDKNFELLPVNDYSEIDSDTTLKFNNALNAVAVLIDMQRHGLTTTVANFDDIPENIFIGDHFSYKNDILERLQQRQARDPREPEWEQLKIEIPETFEKILKDINDTINRIGLMVKGQSNNVKKTTTNYYEFKSKLGSMIVLERHAYLLIGNRRDQLELFEEFKNKKNWMVEFYNCLAKRVREDACGLHEFRILKLSDESILEEIRRDLSCVEKQLGIINDILSNSKTRIFELNKQKCFMQMAEKLEKDDELEKFVENSDINSDW